MKRTPLKRGGSLTRSRLAPMSARRREAMHERRAFRQAVLFNAGHECQRAPCRALFNLEAHHYLPKSRGGTDDPANGRCLCRSCHRGVHDHTLQDWRSWIQSREREL